MPLTLKYNSVSHSGSFWLVIFCRQILKYMLLECALLLIHVNVTLFGVTHRGCIDPRHLQETESLMARC